MPIERTSEISPSVFIADTATVYGKVAIGAESSVWFGAVLRGDTDWLLVGEQTNIQDQVVLHTDAGLVCRLGNRVTIGHGAIIHGSEIENDCLIGMRATVLNRCIIGRGSIVAAGAVLPEDTVVPPNSLVMGVPGKIVRHVTAAESERTQRGWQHYVELGKEMLAKQNEE